MTAGIILAAGTGSRMGLSNRNKVSLNFAGKPLVRHAVELLTNIAHPIVVVVGSHKESVEKVLTQTNVMFSHQEQQLGTGHAVKVGLTQIPQDTNAVIVGYGDHMMFYHQKTLMQLLELQNKNDAAASLVTTVVKNPTGYGRIIRNSNNEVEGIIEEKDATNSQKEICEINAGLYVFNYEFLRQNLDSIQKSEISNEYYLTDLIKIAIQQGKKVVGVKVSYEEVGIGINKPEELTKSQKLYANIKETI